MKGRLQETALVLMPRAFAEQPFPRNSLVTSPRRFLKGAVLPDEHRMQVLGMAGEHRAFRAEPGRRRHRRTALRDGTLQPTGISREKASRWAPGNAFPGAGRHRCGDHT